MNAVNLDAEIGYSSLTRLCDEKGENGVRSNQKAWWLVATWATFAVGQFYGQILHATAPLPSFEVATVKPSNGDNAIPSVSTATESAP